MKCLKRSIVESEMNRRVLDTRQKLRATMSLAKYDSISGVSTLSGGAIKSLKKALEGMEFP